MARRSSGSSSTCYYPNGDTSSDGDIPCSSGGGSVPCCPLNWSCQDNGLCHLAGENYLGRYTCTDPNWGNGCPEICTYNNTASGNEAVLQCSPNSYCCDTNRPDLTNPSHACCETTNSRFSLDNRKSMLPQGSSPSFIYAVSAFYLSPPSSSPLSTPPSSLILTSEIVLGPSSNKNSPSVSVITSVVTKNPTAVSSSSISTSSIPAAPLTATTGLPPVPQTDSGKRHLGAIIGPSVAIPLALITIALAIFFYLRRRREPETENSAYPSGYGAEPKYERELSPNSPYSIPNKAELEGSSPDISSSPATAQTGISRFSSPQIQSTSLSTDPLSASVRASSGLSQMSSVDQPQISNAPAGPIFNPSDPQHGLSELPEKSEVV